MDQFRADVQREDAEIMKRKVSNIDQARGFGGKFGIEKDRMDKSAVGHDYQVSFLLQGVKCFGKVLLYDFRTPNAHIAVLLSKNAAINVNIQYVFSTG